MLAVRPNYHPPAATAKALSTLDTIAPERISLNVVSSWWKDEAAQYGAPFDVHDARYARTEEWLEVLSRLLTRGDGDPRRRALRARGDGARAQALPAADRLHGRRVADARSTSSRRSATPTSCTATRPEIIAAKIADMRERAPARDQPPLHLRRLRLRHLPRHRGRRRRPSSNASWTCAPRPRRTPPTRTSSRARSWSRRSRWRSTASPTAGLRAGLVGTPGADHRADPRLRARPVST